ncbi:class I SAM-dependent methyltransferase [Shewanella sp. BJSY2023SW005]|uniref:class I SAM-dependent methyltransferase n=1 Tax=Shewanella sp. BJSY2023SW005 TaxID=3392043 RepID=UPI0039B46456
MPTHQTQQQTSCKVCGESSWQEIETLMSGIWDKSQTALCRQVLHFPIGRCRYCHHVQVSINYTQEIFAALYFSNQVEPDMWCDTPLGEKSPYEEMLEFIRPSIKEGAHIVDFGAGAGITLKYIEDSCKAYSLTLASVDFHNHIQSETIKYLGADLNKLEAIQGKFDAKPISLAISTHVLEHVVEPIHFLSQIAKMMAENGYIFIEVPDCSPDAYTDHLAFTNLVHGQHIHYYSKESLAQIVRLAGLSVVKQQQLTTGDIPRLLLLLKQSNSASPRAISSIEHDASKAVTKRFNDYQSYQTSLFKQLQQALIDNKKIGLWGVGGDFYQLTQSYPELIQWITCNRVTLYDYELAGHIFAGAEILSSSEIKYVKYPVIILPIYGPTREKMKRISMNWKVEVIDPYSYLLCQ